MRASTGTTIRSPPWVTGALAEGVNLAGKRVWECACGDGRMAETLKAVGADVYSTDIEDRGYRGLDELLDFTSLRNPKRAGFDAIVTNCPWRLATEFIEAGPRRTEKRGSLALLLPIDFNSAITRPEFFRDCPRFASKLVLLGRVVWYPSADAAPKENTAWYLWSHDPQRTDPIIMYSRQHAQLKADYPELT